MKRYRITLDDDIAQIFDVMLEKAQLDASRGMSNLIITLMGEAAAMIEFYGDSNRGGVPALMLDEDDRRLSYNGLFERVKLMHISKLTEIETLKKLAFFKDMPERGQC